MEGESVANPAEGNGCMELDSKLALVPWHGPYHDPRVPGRREASGDDVAMAVNAVDMNVDPPEVIYVTAPLMSAILIMFWGIPVVKYKS
jgi:hypothetical protein